jgi:hypothetical protein
MRAFFVLVLCACATEHAVDIDDPLCCKEVSEPQTRGIDFAEVVNAPERCEAAARAKLPAEAAWQELWGCVSSGHFTALRELLSGAWDRDLQTRPDAPLLVVRVIAARGGNVDSDLALLHDRRVPLFSLSQALARPDLYKGAFVIVRATVSTHGVLEEKRLVGQTSDVPMVNPHVGYYVQKRNRNFDVASGQRVLARGDLFLDDGDPQVVLARFDGLRSTDGWPSLSVLAHERPGPMLVH